MPFYLSHNNGNWDVWSTSDGAMTGIGVVLVLKLVADVPLTIDFASIH